MAFWASVGLFSMRVMVLAMDRRLPLSTSLTSCLIWFNVGPVFLRVGGLFCFLCVFFDEFYDCARGCAWSEYFGYADFF